MQGREMDELKLFVGGIARNTREDTLRDYFSRYGDLTQAVIMMDKSTGHSRGFGFVAFAEPSILDVVVRERHAIDGRKVKL
jgi:RNA-binding protein Musashi